ncbi:TIGR04283 family arsenosugar biosynthesis glycosyltransferase [Clostridia bacterium]|nr:TIGR04283 family arsenosugar biosynthesis glycosyltransferase [Clostridia bacterium]
MNMNRQAKISIIVPVYNEATNIQAFMSYMEQFKPHCEIIFVDGGSDDGTDQILAEKYMLSYSSKKGRSYQMNHGASLASGDILLFLHSDSLLSDGALAEIERIISEGYKVGCFKIRFDSSSILMKICSFMSSVRVRVRNIAFGDQGIFIERDFFNQLGGFAELPLMEDYQLSMDIKRYGQKIALADATIITSERRFTKFGRIRTMAKMQKLQYMHRQGVDSAKIASLYEEDAI